MHFAWYSDGKVSAGDSSDLSNKRKPYEFQLASGYDIIDWTITYIDIVYGEMSYPPENTVSDILLEQYVENDSDSVVTKEFSHETTRESSFEFSLAQTFVVGVSTEFTAEVPFLGSASTTVNVEIGLESSQTWSESESETYSISSSIEVPANSTVNAIWSIDWTNDLTVGFTAIFKVTGTTGHRQMSYEEIRKRLLDQGCDGTITMLQENEAQVEIAGSFSGAYGMESHLLLKPITITKV